MPYPRRLSSRMSEMDISEDVSVVDVYDIASDIGKECEIIIDKFGADAVTSLLPKVINALELLENLAIKCEKDSKAVQELTTKISQLENDKVEKAEYRHRFEKEIEEIEEQWRSESADLVSAVARLQEENKRLRRSVNSSSDGSIAPPSPAREHDQEVLNRLMSTAEKQRNTLRDQELMLQEKQQLIDNMTTQVERLATVSRDLKRKQKQLQNQVRNMCDERNELNALIQGQQRDIATLQMAVGRQEVITDSDNPEDTPRFSTRELSAILDERIQLKHKLQEAEEQLAILRRDEQSTTSTASSSNPQPEEGDDEEAPVQGPLPYEPDDAPWRRQNSGIRKLQDIWNMIRVFVGSLRSLTLSSDPRSLTTQSQHQPAYTQQRRKWSEPNKLEQSPTSLRSELNIQLGENNLDLKLWLGSRVDSFTDTDTSDNDITLTRSLSLDEGLQYLQSTGQNDFRLAVSNYDLNNSYNSYMTLPKNVRFKACNYDCENIVDGHYFKCHQSSRSIDVVKCRYSNSRVDDKVDIISDFPFDDDVACHLLRGAMCDVFFDRFIDSRGNSLTVYCAVAAFKYLFGLWLRHCGHGD